MAKAPEASLALRENLIESFHKIAKTMPISTAFARHYYLYDLFRGLEHKDCRFLTDLTAFSAEDLNTTPDAVQSIKSELAAWGLELRPSAEKSAEEIALAKKLDKRHHPRHDKI